MHAFKVVGAAQYQWNIRTLGRLGASDIIRLYTEETFGVLT